MRFYIIGDKDTVTGFSLVGIEGTKADSGVEALRALKEAINSKDIGIILITERLAKEIQSTIDALMTQRECVLVLQIPDAGGALQGRQSIEEFVLTALGVKV
ncbi:MAG: V-type ATP synthase subunit F [bacterium]